ncbi:FecR family protein [Sphingobacterium suaedae]|uniref:FecR family protein n=1 Tax=Sphingobacterium suaedae TaxID=1686402 RepID=A0ABW5KNE6_9SPHI
MDTTEIAQLIKRYIAGDISEQETYLLDRWRMERVENEVLFKKVVDEKELFEDALVWMNLQEERDAQWSVQFKEQTWQKIRQTPVRRKNLHRFSFGAYSVAAAALLLISVFGYMLWRHQAASSGELNISHIKAGTNKAELILSNGKKIDLRSDKEGIVLDDQFIYSDGTPLLEEDKANLSRLSATIQVPKGGKYTVTLSDGSRVWLNSSSKLSYPCVFNNESREVELEGEAYFEVAKQRVNNRNIPFTVHSKNQRVEVTGTAFNITAYRDDSQEITTLVEGSVTVEAGSRRIQLRPNEQTVCTANGIEKKTVDVESFVAWKDNKFLFNETELRELMKAIGRWYAIDITYRGAPAPTYFYGEIGRDKNLEEVLRILEKSGVKFQLKQQKTGPQLVVIQ